MREKRGASCRSLFGGLVDRRQQLSLHRSARGTPCHGPCGRKRVRASLLAYPTVHGGINFPCACRAPCEGLGVVQQVTSLSLTALDDVASTMSRCQWDTVCGVQDAAGGGTEQRASGPVREREREPSTSSSSSLSSMACM